MICQFRLQIVELGQHALCLCQLLLDQAILACEALESGAQGLVALELLSHLTWTKWSQDRSRICHSIRRALTG